MEPISTKPYFIRAIYDWCVDQGFTPYIVALVDRHTYVPRGYAQDGKIVLNIGPMASNRLDIKNDAISFQARFSGQVHDLYIPMGNVEAIYARENGEGMGFQVVPEEPRQGLSVVSNGEADVEPSPVVAVEPTVVPSSEIAAVPESHDEPEPPPPAPPTGNRPKLTRVK